MRACMPNHKHIAHFHAECDQHLGVLVPDSAGELEARGTSGQSKHSGEGMTPCLVANVFVARHEVII